MSENAPIDYDAIRERFPWVGLVDDEDLPPASQHREVLARAIRDRLAIDALDAARRSA